MSLHLRPYCTSEKEQFFAMPPEEDKIRGCIGHLRMDFGRSGIEFWSTWWPRGPEDMNSPAFKKDLNSVVDELRKTVLSDINGMRQFCRSNNGLMHIDGEAHHGFVIDSKDYRYCLRCIPRQGDYNAYLTCYDKRILSQYLALENPLSQYGDVWVCLCYDGEIQRTNQETGKTESCEGYFCEVHADPYYEYRIDCFYLAVGHEIPDLSDEAVDAGIRKALGLKQEKLPDLCFSTLPSTGELICIKRGESGYYQSGWNTDDPVRNKELADFNNRKLGVTDAQRLAMECGSMVGWDAPGTDPAFYNFTDQGTGGIRMEM